jgi:hypothetical protein
LITEAFCFERCIDPCNNDSLVQHTKAQTAVDNERVVPLISLPRLARGLVLSLLFTSTSRPTNDH